MHYGHVSGGVQYGAGDGGAAAAGRRAAQGAVPAHMTHTRQLGPAARTACMSAQQIQCAVHCTQLYPVILSYTQLFSAENKLYQVIPGCIA